MHKSRELAVAPAKVTDRVYESQRDRANRRHARVPVRRAQLFAQFFERSVPRRIRQRRRTCSRDFALTRFDRSDPRRPPPGTRPARTPRSREDKHASQRHRRWKRSPTRTCSDQRKPELQAPQPRALGDDSCRRARRKDAEPCNPADRVRARHSLARGTQGPWIAAACHHSAFSAEPVDRANDERATQRSRHHRYRSRRATPTTLPASMRLIAEHGLQAIAQQWFKAAHQDCDGFARHNAHARFAVRLSRVNRGSSSTHGVADERVQARTRGRAPALAPSPCPLSSRCGQPLEAAIEWCESIRLQLKSQVSEGPFSRSLRTNVCCMPRPEHSLTRGAGVSSASSCCMRCSASCLPSSWRYHCSLGVFRVSARCSPSREPSHLAGRARGRVCPRAGRVWPSWLAAGC